MTTAKNKRDRHTQTHTDSKEERRRRWRGVGRQPNHTHTHTREIFLFLFLLFNNMTDEWIESRFFLFVPFLFLLHSSRHVRSLCRNLSEAKEMDHTLAHTHTHTHRPESYSTKNNIFLALLTHSARASFLLINDRVTTTASIQHVLLLLLLLLLRLMLQDIPNPTLHCPALPCPVFVCAGVAAERKREICIFAN